jgi:N-acetylmuramoyl-L-alanine amidase
MHTKPTISNKIVIVTLLVLAVQACSVLRPKPKKVIEETAPQVSEEVKPQKEATTPILRTFAAIDSTGLMREMSYTPNFNLRKPNYVIIHHTAQGSCEQTFYTFSIERTQVSSHYVICDKGDISQLLSNNLRAWHAGNSRWGTITDMNSCSIGIELDNDGFEPFSERQIESLIKLLDTLKQKYGIPTANFIGHGDIAPTRKNDPSVKFPWKKLAEAGFGIWYDADAERNSLPEGFDYMWALRIIGYDVRNQKAAIKAFQRHFNAKEIDTLSLTDMRILNNLVKKVIN